MRKGGNWGSISLWLLVGMIAPMKKQKAPLDFIRQRRLYAGLARTWVLCSSAMETCGRPWRRKCLAGPQPIIAAAGLASRCVRILRCLDVFVLTSLWEGLPRVYLEARASGIPVVGMRVDGSRRNHP